MLYKRRGGVCAMVRSISIFHLLIIFIIGFVGGALLYRELPLDSIETLLNLYDERLLLSSTFMWYKPIGITLAFIVIAFVLSLSNKTRFIIILLAAIRVVLFGLSSSYLVGLEKQLMTYSIWWYPFQLATCVTYLVYCALLSPPFFVRPQLRNTNYRKSLPMIMIVMIVIQFVELAIYTFIIHK